MGSYRIGSWKQFGLFTIVEMFIARVDFVNSWKKNDGVYQPEGREEIDVPRPLNATTFGRNIFIFCARTSAPAPISSLQNDRSIDVIVWCWPFSPSSIALTSLCPLPLWSVVAQCW